MTQLADYMKLRKKEDQSMGASVLLRRENKQSQEAEGGKDFRGIEDGKRKKVEKDQVWEEMVEMYRRPGN